MNRRFFFSVLGVVILLHGAFFWYISDKPIKVRTSTSRPIPPRSFFSATGVYEDPVGDGKLVVREFTVSTKLENLSTALPTEGETHTQNVAEAPQSPQSPQSPNAPASATE